MSYTRITSSTWLKSVTHVLNEFMHLMVTHIQLESNLIRKCKPPPN